MDPGPSQNSETFAAYLTKQYIVKKGFRPGTVPEAKALAEHADIYLHRSDGLSLQMIFIVDAEAHPGKIFAMTPVEINQAGVACLNYCGTVSGNKMPLIIQIIEVGPTSITNEQTERLEKLRLQSSRSKVVVSTAAVDTSTASVAYFARPIPRWRESRFIKRLMSKPRLNDNELQSTIAVTRKNAVRPLLTLFILAAMAAVFVAEQVFMLGEPGKYFEPNLKTLWVLGALNKTLVLHGEWYRFFSATLLHGGFLHLIFNGVALYLAGMLLENLIGRAWTGTIFILGAMGGWCMSLAINDSHTVSVGASGAIMALLVTAYIVTHRLPFGPARSEAQMNLLQILIPSLLPLMPSLSGQQVDFGAHLGGALTGLVLGWILVSIWPKKSPLPPLRIFATGICVIGLCGFAWALLVTTVVYQQALQRGL